MATNDIKKYTPADYNEENQQIAIIDDEGEQEEEEEDDDEEDEDVENCAAQSMEVAKVNVNRCTGTHLGHKSVYHGSVKVRNFLKINVPTPDIGQSTAGLIGFPTANTPTTGTPVVTYPISPTVMATPFEYKPVGAVIFEEETYIPAALPRVSTSESSGRPSDVSNELIESSENNDTRNSDTIYPTSGSGSDEEALIPGLNNNKTKNILLMTILAIVVIFVIFLIFILVWYYANVNTDSDNLPMNFTARLTTRGVWFAFPPKKVMPPFKYNPVPFLVVCHTASVPCYTQRSCRTMVRNIQAGQMESIFDDISYNFLIGGDGFIYEGRGWIEASAGTPVMDCSALSIGFIGNFVVDKPSLKQLDAFKLILKEGVALGKLDSKYSMFMQKQIVSTESPGEELIEILQSWSHWKPFDTEDLICNKTHTKNY